MNIGKIYPDKSHENILILGTGPSVFYNIAKLDKYIKTYSPTIVGINGCFHGLSQINGSIHKSINPYGKAVTIDATDIEIYPHILFSFLLRRDKNTVSGKRIHNDKNRKDSSDLFKYFILKHKKDITRRRIALLCPDNFTYRLNYVKRRYGHKRYGQAKWKYHRYYEFRVFPKGYRRSRAGNFDLKSIRNVKSVFDKTIKFKVGHGGEYVLSWVLAQKPKRIAICGMCDFPNNAKKRLRRGWFWLERKREMPPNMGKKQAILINYIKRTYADRFDNLNLQDI